MTTTRRLLLPIFSVALLAAAAGLAAADPAPSAGDLAASDCARARKAHKACVLTFGQGTEINGDKPSGDGTTVTAATHDKMPSLIHLRADFRAEIIKAAEDL